MRLLLTLTFFVAIFNISNAQYCIPQGNCVFGDYIDDFTFNTINNINSRGSNCGTFQNPGNAYSLSTQTTTVVQGQSYAVSMAGRNNGRAQGYAVWIDYNGDGDFNDAGEFACISPTTTGQTYNDSIHIPLNVKFGTTRMRVRSLRGSVIFNYQACATLNRGETEDYNITINPIPGPPLTDFEASSTQSCDGKIQFTDLTPSVVNSWVWEFGNGDTSHKQNPSYTYTTTGTYTVKLTATNSNGSKTETKSNYISVTIGGGPSSPNCTPSIGTSAAGFGITSFSFSNVNYNSNDATVGYEDNSCAIANVTVGKKYVLKFGSVTAQANQNFRAWIDYNGDGTFSTQEMVLNQNNVIEANDTIIIPTGALTTSPLRVRVAGVYYLNSPASFTSCTTLQNGQMDDYAIKVSPNTSKPTVDFAADPTTSCDGVVQFQDLSTDVPTGWNWDFGDGNSSMAQNPKHTYNSSGIYTVKLRASNTFGQDSLIKTNLVTVNLSGAVKAACSVNTTSHIDDYGITNVLFNTINNFSPDGSVGYEDFSCSQQTTVKENQPYQLEIKTGSLNKEDVKVWIDLDNDGTFKSNELIMTSVNNNIHKMTYTVSSVAVKYKPLRMRVVSDIVGTDPGPCDNTTYGQTEDYGIIIEGDTTTPPSPVCDFSADTTQSCTGVIRFTDNSTNSPNSYSWDFGDGNTSSSKNPSHTYANQGTFTVKLTVSNSFGTDTETKTGYITVDDLNCTNTSVQLLNGDKVFKVYPNPTTGIINLELIDLEIHNYSVRVMSMHGQTVYFGQLEDDRSMIDLSGFKKSVYFVVLESDNQRFVKRITTH